MKDIISSPIVCPSCKGDKKVKVDVKGQTKELPCPVCNGTGVKGIVKK
jgi:DnaJ-class molecular chaperone